MFNAINTVNYNLPNINFQPNRPVAGQTARVGHQGTVNGDETQFWAPFTGAYNLTRNPAGSEPVGFTSDGMPVGLQVIGPQQGDIQVMQTIGAIEDLLELNTVAPIS